MCAPKADLASPPVRAVGPHTGGAAGARAKLFVKMMELATSVDTVMVAADDGAAAQQQHDEDEEAGGSGSSSTGGSLSVLHGAAGSYVLSDIEALVGDEEYVKRREELAAMVGGRLQEVLA